jgi:hypothetical protein
MTKRSTEEVLRAEVAKAEKELERANARAVVAAGAVVEAQERKEELETEARQAAAALSRAKGALAAFTGYVSPKREAEEVPT